MRLWRLSVVWIVTILLFCAGRVQSSYVPCLPGSGGDLRTDAKTPLVVTIDTSWPRQTIRGFGASDAWSIQFVGQWPGQQREAIADLLFHTGLDDDKNPRGIGLSAWRFNLGAGSSRQNNISDVWRRADSFLDAALVGYDWSRCPGQRWFLQAARARGVERFIAFVNSPPVNMTKNGFASCSTSSGTTNLRDDRIAEFAAYLARVLEHFRDVEDIDFEGISPFNEPNWEWNDAGQEGCRYYNTDIVKIVTALHQQLRNRQLDTKIEVVESGDITYLYDYPNNRGDYIDAFFDSDSPHYIGDKVANRISSHSYSTCWPDDGRLVNWRRRLRTKLDQYPGLGYTMSEYCILIPNSSWVPAEYRDYGNRRDLGIDPALWVARVIHHDLTVAQASDWHWWLAVSPYDYKDGLVYIDKAMSGGKYYSSKMLWAVGNFSRFIRPGMKRVTVSRSDDASAESTVEDLMVSAYWKREDGTVVVVFVNWTTRDRSVRLEFEGLEVGSLVPYVTRGNSSSTDNLAAYCAVDSRDPIAIPARSVVTLVGSVTNFGDWDQNAKVDWRDFAILADRWTGKNNDTDSGKPGVGFRDVHDLAKYWLADFGLAAHWRLDEVSGDVARDSVGHRDAILQGGSAWRPNAGRFRGALEFDGVDDYVSTPLALDPAVRTFTVSAWIKGNSPSRVILSQAGGANWLMTAPNGTLRTELKQAGRFGKALGSAAVITDGAWHRVGLTWDGSSRILYVDGSEVARDTQAGVQSSGGSLSIGADGAMEPACFWKGLIDDVRVHNRPVQP